MIELYSHNLKDKMFKKIAKVIAEYNDDELRHLVKSGEELEKIIKKVQLNEKSIKQFLAKLKKIDITLRDKFVLIIDKYIPPFTDYKIERDNSIIKIAVNEEIMKRFYKIK